MFATIPGGRDNLAGGQYSFAAGRRAKANHPGSFVWGDATDADFASTDTNQFLIRASGGARVVAPSLQVVGGTFVGNGSGLINLTVNAANVVGLPVASAFWQLGGNSSVGSTNSLGTIFADPLEFKVWNGRALRIEPTFTVSGTPPFQFAVPATPNIIAGYSGNLVSNGVAGATISGGGIGASILFPAQINRVGGDGATVSGGVGNTAGGDYATVAGGANNRANGGYSFAAGLRAKADHQGAFVWADSQGSDFASTANNQFLLRAAGGVGININNPFATWTVGGDAAIDATGQNTGSLAPGLTFGANSGEGIASKRNAGGNQYGLDFYTSFVPRLSIANNGTVDIDTGNGHVQVINDLVPAINVTGGSLPGILRFRNAMEIWPSQDGTRAGNLDVRDTDGTAKVTLRGNGTATVKVLEITGGADVAEPFPLSQRTSRKALWW